MTELEVLTQINDNMLLLRQAVELLFYVYLFFKLLEWIRRIVTKWKKGMGDYSE